MTRRQTCTNHCATCGGHFNTLRAFEGHRRDFQCPPPAEAVDEKGRRLLQMWTDDGWCDLEPGCYQEGRRVRWAHPVVVWQARPTEQQAAWLEKARSRLVGTASAPETESAGHLDAPAQGPSGRDLGEAS